MKLTNSPRLFIYSIFFSNLILLSKNFKFFHYMIFYYNLPVNKAKIRLKLVFNFNLKPSLEANTLSICNTCSLPNKGLKEQLPIFLFLRSSLTRNRVQNARDVLERKKDAAPPQCCPLSAMRTATLRGNLKKVSFSNSYFSFI